MEPRDEIEATLTELWRDLLGVSQVGVLDNFFDLGGHSLIAVRLFAKVKRVFSVEFPISVLFEAPTIEACAALIRGARPVERGRGYDRASTVSSRPRYRHLVPMHPGEGGPGRPFFLVAGMFGNVLNLRHLAHQVGIDRPFYGVQARGLYGDDEPHETFEEMARRLPRRDPPGAAAGPLPARRLLGRRDCRLRDGPAADGSRESRSSCSSCSTRPCPGPSR